VRNTDARSAADAARRKIAAFEAAYHKDAPVPGFEATSVNSQLAYRASRASVSLPTHASSGQHQARDKKTHTLDTPPHEQVKLPPSKAAARVRSILRAIRGVPVMRAQARDEQSRVLGKHPRVLGGRPRVLGKKPQIKTAIRVRKIFKTLRGVTVPTLSAHDEPRNARRDDDSGMCVRVCACVCVCVCMWCVLNMMGCLYLFAFELLGVCC